MNCYVCSAQGQDRLCTAVAICHQCGAGMCHEHLFTLGGTAPMGLAGNSSRRFICSFCNDLLTGHYRKNFPGANDRERTSPWQRWWNCWRSHEEALPEPHEAVTAVERFLQTKRQ